MAFTSKPTGGADAGVEMSRPVLLDVRQVAKMLNASSRTVYRLSDMGRMPQPVKLGALVRWRAVELRDWIDAGCPTCRKGGAKC
ncbi:MAG TPA: hypothetical protein DER01_06510 [Phycisphaerales bacterium]|nr:hypothetical protein [Phycisphaerales bacterium]|tara:strand:+ start:15900 stop:16151 length:252 start_codon:yes stop_codon:yes gene_type:complete